MDTSILSSEDVVVPSTGAAATSDATSPRIANAEVCGPNLEYDPAFQAMEAAARGKPELQVGDEVIPPEEPDWRLLREVAQDLLARTTDLRVLVQLTCARTRLEGFEGLEESLRLLERVLAEHWEGVHPQLDPGDELDPTMRINILGSLVDPDSMLRAVREAPLAESRVGSMSLKNVQAADGESAPGADEGQAPSRAQIEAVFAGSDVDALWRHATAIDRSLESLETINELLNERVGTDRAPDLGSLTSLLGEARSVLAAHLPSDSGEGAPGGELAVGRPMGGDGEADGSVRTRDDVVRLLERICDYYERQEPSSPVPLLLTRAKRLVAKDFMHIMRDIASDGVQQIESIAGLEDSEEAEE